MKITPNQLDIWSSQIAEIYNALEGEIIKLIIDRMKSRGVESVATWQIEKLRDFKLLNKETIKLLAKTTGIAQQEIERVFTETGMGTIEEVDKALKKTGVATATIMDTIVRNYYKQTWLEIDNLVNQTLVSTNYGINTAVTREYTQVLNKTQALFNTGVYTQDEAMQKAVSELAQKGIRSGFIDKGGNTWSMERYVRTVLKSTLSNTYNEVKKERMGEFGVHTVLVTSHMGARDACARIQGQVVDLRWPDEIPEGSEYRSIYDPYWRADYGKPGGHRGVNCRHDHIPFIPGVNKNNQPQYGLEENRAVAKATQKQRYIERQIVRYKKNQMVAEHLENPEAEEWKKRVLSAQKKMREHIAENNEYLSRDYQREKVYTPLDVLIKDKKTLSFFKFEDVKEQTTKETRPRKKRKE